MAVATAYAVGVCYIKSGRGSGDMNLNDGEGSPFDAPKDLPMETRPTTPESKETNVSLMNQGDAVQPESRKQTGRKTQNTGHVCVTCGRKYSSL
ncbi:hypothetical protein T265_07868 [Opisthorchis viverrini]|uniref:Uncharacterized protein n=1 Tax=Opisthorchis viverrini TaxID=6198 RepID=A0A074ZFT8_OPIVI|nr:hypothetical protein T265_07868 [Opisthorchis viverrini]KER24507.1 hypothetical protein T265_07868 [Opisthorchis viverrini]